MSVFTTGLSGLTAAQKNLEVVSNNVANVNSIGFKKSRTEFGDFYAASFTNFPKDRIGIGTQLNEVRQNFIQGALTPTGGALDIAISGEGFFKTQLPDGRELYTRNGQFGLNRDGFIVNNQGYFLTGYPIDAETGAMGPDEEKILIDQEPIPPKATASVGLKYNLDTTAEVPTGGAFDLGDPTTYTSTTSLIAYNQQGKEIPIDVFWIKTATDNQWNYKVFATDSAGTRTEVTPAAPADLLEFDAAGLPINPDTDFTVDIDLTAVDPDFAPARAEENLAANSFRLKLGDATQQGAGFSVRTIAQDGYTTAAFTGPSFLDDGTLVLNYANGEKVSLAKVALFKFSNNDGLRPAGNNAWEATKDVGTIYLSRNNDSAFGLVQGGFLEESNVDLTAELVEMIEAQRTYQANSQSIRTQDQIIQTATNLRS